MRYLAPLVFVLSVVACGDDSDNQPLLSGAVTGSFEGASFTIKNGVLGKTSQGSNVIGLSSESFGCDTLTATDPPEGNFASIAIPSVAVGTYSNVSVQLYENHGSFSGRGSSSGTLEVTAVSADSIAGTISYSDTIEAQSYALNGTFELSRCD